MRWKLSALEHVIEGNLVFRANVEGSFDLVRLRLALDRVQYKHPVLRALIDKEPVTTRDIIGTYNPPNWWKRKYSHWSQIAATQHAAKPLLRCVCCGPDTYLRVLGRSRY